MAQENRDRIGFPKIAHYIMVWVFLKPFLIGLRTALQLVGAWLTSCITNVNKMESGDLIDVATNSSGKSDVWKHFGFPVYTKDGQRQTDKSKTACKLCKKLFTYTGNTTNMRTHMSRHHPTHSLQNTIAIGEKERPQVLKDLAKPTKQPTLSEVIKKTTKYDAKSARAQLITKQVATYLVSDMRPLSIVDNADFKKLLDILDPKYNLPSRRHFAEKVIPNLYNDTKAVLFSLLNEASSVAVTTDSWTSRACQSYMTVTAHFMSADWKLENFVLTTRMLSESHTGENIGNALKEVTKEWKLERPTGIPVVSDNAANMDIAMKTAELSPHIKCFAHTVNLASQRGLKVNAMARLLGRIRRIVTFFHKSTTATAVLASKQILMELPKHRMVTDVATRWNSSFEMIERFLEQQPAILATLTSQEVKKNVKDIVTLTDKDINDAESALSVLKPLKTITAVMCSEEFPTVSLIFPLKEQILTSMGQKDSDSGFIAEVKAAVRADIQKRYSSNEVEDFLMVASALDPRFPSLPQLDDEKRDHVYDCVATRASKSAASLVVKQEQAEGTEPVTATNPASQKEPTLPALPDVPADEGPTPPKVQALDIPPVPSTSSAMEDLFGDVYFVSATPGIPTATRITEEIQKYRQEPAIPVRDSPLDWWKANASKYPLLAAVAKSVLSIPGTSVPSERVFSTAGDIVSATRSCLDHDLVDKLIFLKKNLKKVQ